MRRNLKSLMLGIAALVAVGVVAVWVMKEREARRLKAEEISARAEADGRGTGVEEERAMGGPERAGMSVPEQARAMMDGAMTLPVADERARAAAGVIRELCEAGYAEEAWQVIAREKGEVRELQLLMFFHRAKLPPREMLEKMKTLADADKPAKVLETYFSRLSLEGILRAMEEPEFLKDYKTLEAARKARGGDGPPLLVGVMKERRSHSRSDAVSRQISDFAREMYRLTAIDGSALMDVLVGDTSRNAFDRWEDAAGELKGEGKVYENDRGRAMLIDAMLREDAIKAMQGFTAEDSPQALADLAVAMQLWRGFDTTGSGEWVEAKAAELGTAQRDVVMTVLSRAARREGKPDEAAAWAEKVTDAKLKAGLLEGK